MSSPAKPLTVSEPPRLRLKMSLLMLPVRLSLPTVPLKFAIFRDPFASLVQVARGPPLGCSYRPNVGDGKELFRRLGRIQALEGWVPIIERPILLQYRANRALKDIGDAEKRIMSAPISSDLKSGSLVYHCGAEAREARDPGHQAARQPARHGAGLFARRRRRVEAIHADPSLVSKYTGRAKPGVRSSPTARRCWASATSGRWPPSP